MLVICVKKCYNKCTYHIVDMKNENPFLIFPNKEEFYANKSETFQTGGEPGDGSGDGAVCRGCNRYTPGGYLERYLQVQRTVTITSTAFVLTRAALRRMNSRRQTTTVHTRLQTPETSTGSQSR